VDPAVEAVKPEEDRLQGYVCGKSFAPTQSYGYQKNNSMMDTDGVGENGGLCSCPDGEKLPAGE
jgi:hypothetical protein